MIYKYVWQICQQSLKIISIEQSFVRGNYTFSELCSCRKYPYPSVLNKLSDILLLPVFKIIVIDCSDHL